MMNVNSDVSNLKGVGPKLKDCLNSLGVFTIKDLLLYFPRNYDNVDDFDLESNQDSKHCVVDGIVTKIERDIRSKNGMIITTVFLKVRDKDLICKWFNQPYMKNSFRVGSQYKLHGKLSLFQGRQVLTNAKIVSAYQADKSIIPKYAVNKAITSSTLIKLISQVLLNVQIKENLPSHLVNEYKLVELDEAIRNIHAPENKESLFEAKKRLKFQELFTFSLKVLMLKNYSRTNNSGIKYKMAEELAELRDLLPFQLTNSQRKAVREILIDQKSNYPMNRLLQGDVGSGKTIVAMIALFNVIKNGYQGALMVPTEILANQHYLEAIKIMGKFDVKIALLTGSLPQKAKNSLKEDINSGKINLVIGTHALIEDDVKFLNLGMIVTDEQHRFGVYQRTRLLNKGNNIDVLVMSATPIPRTLALFIYADLDISIINELPPGRQPIETKLIDRKGREKAYRKVVDEINKGRQAYIVCPLIEESETLELQSAKALFEELKEEYFKDIDIALLHGRMKASEKDNVMSEFKSGRTKVLISTTVIEVGVNVPNSSVMVIENAERFGLAQLHQLRGRVGRGEYKSYCILLADIKNDNTRKRMNILVENSDGFKIAEEDMRLRGSGDMFGINQSGDAGLILADIYEDIELLKVANKEARNVIKNQEMYKDLLAELKETMENSSKLICFN